MTRFFLIASVLLLLAPVMAARAGPWKRHFLQFTILLVLSLPVWIWLWPETALLDFVGIDFAPLHHLESSSAIDCLGCVWCIGVALGLLQMAVQIHKVAVWRKASATLPHTVLQEAATTLSLSVVDVSRFFRISHCSWGPASLPTLPSQTMLPTDWMDWTPRQRQAALRHEWYHALNHDAYWGMLLDLFTVVFWFHPLTWSLRHCWKEEIELQADQAAIGQTDPADYAADLLQLIVSNQGLHCPAGIGFAKRSSSNRFHRRIASILNSHPAIRSPGTRTAAILCSLLLSAAAFLGVAWLAGSDPNPLEVEVSKRLIANPFPADSP